MNDIACMDSHPFGVGPRQTKHAFELRVFRQNPGNLGFLAAHDVGHRFDLFDTGKDKHAQSRIARIGTTDLVESDRLARRLPIGNFDPTLARADHATGNHRRATVWREPIAGQRQQGRLETGSIQFRHALIR